MTGPSTQAAEEFGAPKSAVPLSGGEGRTWRAGDVVLRREHPEDAEEASWTADLFAGLREEGFRVPRPVRARSGGWLVDGFSAWTFIGGRPATRADGPAVAAAVAAFHCALVGVPRPLYLDQRTGPFADADRGAWGELPPVDGPAGDVLPALAALRGPVGGLTDQLIHGDLNPDNVLVAPGLAPAIIDLAPYWRPAPFASAVAAFWLGPYRGDTEVLAAFEHVPAFDQMLLRACVRTLLIAWGFRPRASIDAYRPAIEIVQWRLGRRPCRSA